MTLLITNGGYALFIRLDLMFSMSLWKEFLILEISNNLSIRHLIKLIKKDNKSHIFKHLHSATTCLDSYNSLCFKVIDKANSKFDLKNKEALHIKGRKANLNAQQNHLAFTLLL